MNNQDILEQNPRGIIILEGPDGSGKTSLANKFVEKYGARYLHLTYRWRDKMPVYHLAAIQRAAKLADEGKLVVVDRWWPSEYIYSDTFRGGVRWPLYGRYMERIMLKYAGLYVFCIPSNVKLSIERFDKLRSEREELYEDVVEIIKRYTELYYGNSLYIDDNYAAQLTKYGGILNQPNVCMPYSIDREGTEEKSIDKYCETVIEKLGIWRKEQYENALSTSYLNFTGHIHTAHFMFIGDRLNTNKNVVGYPFFDFIDSGNYLTDAINRIPIKEQHIILTNAFLPGGELNEDIEIILNWRKHIIPIALGNNASNSLGDIEHIKICHPAYHMRFEHDIKTYTEIIREALLQ
jgi:thymidylate kinase